MKKTLLAITLALPLVASSCLGPNRLFNSLGNWNAEATEQNWLNEIIFIGLNIIPVYGIAYFADIVAFNTIGYWSGDNPIEDPGPFPESFSSK